MTVKENFRFYGGIYGLSGKEIKEKTDFFLQKLNMENTRDVVLSEIPLGWKQKLAFSVSIIHDPKVVFLDEPTGGLTLLLVDSFWEMIYENADKGTTVFVTTHYMDEAEHCDRLSLMTHGNIVALGTSQGLKDKVNSQIGSLLQIKTNDVFASVEILKPLFPYCSVYGPYVHLYTHDETQARKYDTRYAFVNKII